MKAFEGRQIYPTSNNRESSRSHVVVCLDLKKNDKIVKKIIVCDLAGVENKFNCNDPFDMGRFSTGYNENSKYSKSAENWKDQKDSVNFVSSMANKSNGCYPDGTVDELTPQKLIDEFEGVKNRLISDIDNIPEEPSNFNNQAIFDFISKNYDDLHKYIRLSMPITNPTSKKEKNH